MILFVFLVLGSPAWYAFHGTLPRAEVMGLVGLAALIASGGVALLLYRFRACDTNMRSVWICSRNDALGIKLPQDRLLHAKRLAGCIPKLEQVGAVTKPAELRQGGDVEAPFPRAIVKCRRPLLPHLLFASDTCTPGLRVNALPPVGL